MINSRGGSGHFSASGVSTSTRWCLLQPDGACYNQMVPVTTRWCLLQPDGACYNQMVPVTTRWCLLQPDGACYNQMVPVTSTKTYNIGLLFEITLESFDFLIQTDQSITPTSIL
ncbi:hypothetical protein RRG08_029066 [Elysia crispata]|uniref:Uncharacterized protein n=1 Tax=Elysia crispata TaxID=231223 RepID=A0AAE0ZL99_9GAST|nr:hypothetical protein RRG08_029066 [Elysia crispata]